MRRLVLGLLDDFSLLTILFVAFVPVVWCMARPPGLADNLPPVETA